MYRNILVPIVPDHQGKGAHAVQVARLLADKDATITLLHVMEAIPGYAETYIPKEVRDRNRKEAEADLKALATEAGAQARTVVLGGHAGRAIVDYAHEQSVDCIVLASHKPELEDYFLGSTAARVVRHAECSVHVIR